ncbi:WD domain, G-beta repeat family protein [Lyngbya aestuarii BL J]|uniref:WD domain, G-beta repeat family protein n=1 Tax=Lyngbya aestuarii BL J TaxID=1348334 RepID=U7QJ81_9CYAN|nr:WD domain, G-beta repeat family protein [Lyngbya aestuarii]ERT06471.1 WD domain, G-beta repeat family protein [Lyngbya aestuarii BL J]
MNTKANNLSVQSNNFILTPHQYKRPQTLTGHLGSISELAIAFDGKTLISSSYDSTLKLWEVKTGRILETLMAHNKDFNTIAIANNGKLLVSGGSDNTIKIWRLQRTSEILRLLYSILLNRGIIFLYNQSQRLRIRYELDAIRCGSIDQYSWSCSRNYLGSNASIGIGSIVS